MFVFHVTDEGYQVMTPEGRVVAAVDCCKIDLVDDPRLKAPERVVRKFPKDEWRVHFTAMRLTPPQLTELAKELEKQEF